MIIKLNDIEFNVILIYERRRSITLKVENNNLIIKSYKQLSIDELNYFISRHKRFILNRINEKNELDDSIHILGKKYKLEIINNEFNNILIDDYLNICKIYTNNKNNVKRIIYNYYKNVLENIIYEYNDNIKKEMNINFNVDIEYKYVKTYFGECFPKRKLIILNLKLAKYDINYILSVIYHEYAHFYYQNHQDAFYKFLETKFKNYKLVNKELKRIKYNDIY